MPNQLNLPVSAQIGNVVDPTSAQQAATKNYVDVLNRLDKLRDVNVTNGSAINSQVLGYDSTSSKWIAKTISLTPSMTADTTPVDNSGLKISNSATSGSIDQKLVIGAKLSTSNGPVGAGIGIDPTGLYAALNPQNNGNAVAPTGTVSATNPMSFWTLNAGRNLTATLINGVLTLDASGGGGGGGLTAATLWHTNQNATKQSHSNATGNAQGAANPDSQDITVTVSFGNPATTTISTIVWEGVKADGVTPFKVTWTPTTPYSVAPQASGMYLFNIPQADILAADPDGFVQNGTMMSVSVSGMFGTTSYNGIGAGSVGNTQPAPPVAPRLSAPSVSLPPRSFFATAGAGTVTATVSGGSSPSHNTDWTASSPTPTTTTATSATWTNQAPGTSISVSVSGQTDGATGGAIDTPYGPLTATATVSQPTFLPWYNQSVTGANTPPTWDTTTGASNSGIAIGQSATYTAATGGSFWIAVANSASAATTFTVTWNGITYPANPDTTSTTTIGTGSEATTYNVYGWTTGPIASNSNPQQNSVFTVATI